MRIRLKSISISSPPDFLFVEKGQKIYNGHERKRQRTAPGGGSGFDFDIIKRCCAFHFINEGIFQNPSRETLSFEAH